MGSGKITLGKLEPVDPRKVWESEASDFTPWLAKEDNLKLLGDTIGIELEFDRQGQRTPTSGRMPAHCRAAVTNENAGHVRSWQSCGGSSNKGVVSISR